MVTVLCVTVVTVINSAMQISSMRYCDVCVLVVTVNECAIWGLQKGGKTDTFHNFRQIYFAILDSGLVLSGLWSGRTGLWSGLDSGLYWTLVWTGLWSGLDSGLV